MQKTARLFATVPETLVGERFDRVLVALFPRWSRGQLQRWIHAGAARVEGRVLRPHDAVRAAEQIILEPVERTESPWTAEPLPLDLVHEDAGLLIIAKPAGLVVHPAAGNPGGTLVNALLHRFPELAAVPRAGIVHRLDKETSGLLAVARTLETHAALTRQIQRREIEREYEAVAVGALISGGRIEAPIGRHPVDRKRMAVARGGREAATQYRIVERFRAHTHLRLRLESGRTHQIRVHMAHIRHPLVGDPLYGGRLRLPPACTARLSALLHDFRRQALHAVRLAFAHPLTGAQCEWRLPLPTDMVKLIDALRADAARPV